MEMTTQHLPISENGCTHREQLKRRFHWAAVVIAFVGFRFEDTHPRIGATVLLVSGIAYGLGFVVVWPEPKHRVLSQYPRFGALLFAMYLVGSIVLYLLTVGLFFAFAPSRHL